MYMRELWGDGRSIVAEPHLAGAAANGGGVGDPTALAWARKLRRGCQPSKGSNIDSWRTKHRVLNYRQVDKTANSEGRRAPSVGWYWNTAATARGCVRHEPLAYYN